MENTRKYIERDNIIKNDGSKGKICNNCGGYGFLNNLSGGAQGCPKCEQTGVEMPSMFELLKEIQSMKETILELKKLS